MRSTPRSAKVVALLAGTALVAAACGSDNGEQQRHAPPRPPSSGGPDHRGRRQHRVPREHRAAAPRRRRRRHDADHQAQPRRGVGRRHADHRRRTSSAPGKATLNTPGSISTAGYDQITSVDASDPTTAVVVTFSEPYAAVQEPVLGNRGIIKADAVANCDDISGDLQRLDPVLRPAVEAWSRGARTRRSSCPTRTTGARTTCPSPPQVVMVPKADSDTEINSLKSGEVGLHLPAGLRRHHRRAERPEHQVHAGLRHELRGPVLPAAQRARSPTRSSAQAFSMSVDRDLILKTIYEPIFPGVQAAAVRPVGADGRQVVRRHASSTNSYDPAARREAADRQRLDEGRRRLLGRRTAPSPRSAGWSTPATSAVRTPRP